jgi:hypothetical protein
VAHMLIEPGTDLAAQDGDGWTSLHLTSQEGQGSGLGRNPRHSTSTSSISCHWHPHGKIEKYEKYYISII